ncbi:MAG: hypothetical protein PHV47_01120 [Candidatus Pacebacteria bacterium]|nr:hypothetical protein [Candidatus Paceibacterota bacterium]
MKIAVMAGDENGPRRAVLPPMSYDSLDDVEKKAANLRGMVSGWFPKGTPITEGVPHLYLVDDHGKVLSSGQVFLVADRFVRPPVA